MVEREHAERIFLLTAIGLLGYLAFQLFQPFLDWVILGFLFAYLFYNVYLKLKSKLRKAGLAAGTILTLILILFFMPFFIIIGILLRDVNDLITITGNIDIEATVRNVMTAMAGAVGAGVPPETIQDAATEVSVVIRQRTIEFFQELFASIFQFAARVLLGLFLFGFTIFYGLVDGPRMVAGVMDIIPLRRPEKTDLLLELKRVTDAVFVGHILVSFIQAAIGTAGFLLLGVPRSVFWGFVMLVAALIPVIGPFIVWLPIGFYLLATPGPLDGPLPFIDRREYAALGVLLFVGPIVSTVDNILRPKLVGKRANVHPFLVLIGALGGLFVFGFTGFVMGPLVLSLLLAVLNVYQKHWRGESARSPLLALGAASDLPPPEVALGKRAKRARATGKRSR